MDHVAGAIAARPEYVLLDEQKVVFEKILVLAASCRRSRTKSSIIVRGGPGTGKSVIAMNFVGELSKRGINADYATGSKAFTETLRKIVGRRAEVKFRYFNSYMQADPDSLDVIVCDEAHRIRETSNNRFTPKATRSTGAQVDELLDAARVGVFFVDDGQVVRPGEIGSSGYIIERARNSGVDIHEFELEAQFRCAGSDGFVNWVNNTLGIKRTANVLLEAEEIFDFRILPSPSALGEAIREKAGEGFSARMTAGFCWRWSKKPDAAGNLIKDIEIDAYDRAWNAHHEATGLRRGIPKASLSAHDPGGIDQVGCVYTAQGFEFDYVGVIFGRDLRYDLDRQVWVGDPTESHDTVVKRSGDEFLRLVKNTYRVLLSRGMKGCYVHFMDKDTERFFRSRLATPLTETGG